MALPSSFISYVSISTSSSSHHRILADHSPPPSSSLLALNHDDDFDYDLPSFASQCLLFLPPLLDTFSFTSNSRTFACIVSHPFHFSAIADGALNKSSVMSFLRHVRDEFLSFVHGRLGEDVDPDRLQDRCFQEDFQPAFGKLFSRVSGMGTSPDRETGRRVQDEGDGDGEETANPSQIGADLESGLHHPLPPEGLDPQTSAAVDVAVGTHESTSNATRRPKRHRPFLCWPRKKHNVQTRNIDGLDSTPEPTRNENRALKLLGLSPVSQKALCRSVKLILVFDVVACIVLFCIWMGFCKGVSCIKSE